MLPGFSGSPPFGMPNGVPGMTPGMAPGMAPGMMAPGMMGPAGIMPFMPGMDVVNGGAGVPPHLQMFLGMQPQPGGMAMGAMGMGMPNPAGAGGLGTPAGSAPDQSVASKGANDAGSAAKADAKGASEEGKDSDDSKATTEKKAEGAGGDNDATSARDESGRSPSDEPRTGPGEPQGDEFDAPHAHFSETAQQARRTINCVAIVQQQLIFTFYIMSACLSTRAKAVVFVLGH